MTSSKKAKCAYKFGTRIEEFRLANGMRVLVAERHLDPVVAVMTYYRVGARNERQDEAGVSHFLEHMMFKGSKRFAKGEVDLVTTLLGGSNNAFTSADHTAYWFELASDRWEKALEIEADRMCGLTLDPVEFDAEKAVVLEELAMGDDDPWRHLEKQVKSLLFPRHPYRRPVIGYADTLEAMAADDMRDYYSRFYHPGNATLVVCGDVSTRKALAAARKHFGKIPAGPAYGEADCLRTDDPEPTGERRLTTYWDDPASRLCMAWRAVKVASDDDYALDLASTVLTGGRLSRLYRRIVLEKGLATSISSHNDARVDDGIFWIFAECAQGVKPERLEAAIHEEIGRLATENVPARELRRAKAMLLASDAYHSETVSDLAEDLGNFAVDADWRLAVDGAERHQRVTARELRGCVQRLLDADRRVVGWCLPRERSEEARAPVRVRAAARRGASGKAAKGGKHAGGKG